MIKRTLYFGNPAYLSSKNNQLVINKPKGDDDNEIIKTVPIEDIGIIILDNRRITITSFAIESLLDNNAAIITCDSKSMPVGLLLPLAGNTLQNERFRHQLNASLPLRKQLWQQTIERKILNQSAVLNAVTNEEHKSMSLWASNVKSGDSENLEARAAAYYWKSLFSEEYDFTRERHGTEPNNLLNYGYAILRAVVARALVAAGLLPTLGIHHHNRYNAYCLADDIMEPYRPYVDQLVLQICNMEDDVSELSMGIKAKLLTIPTLDVRIDGHRSPLIIAVNTTAASLVKCFSGERKKLIYPEM